MTGRRHFDCVTCLRNCQPNDQTMLSIEYIVLTVFPQHFYPSNMLCFPGEVGGEGGGGG